MTRQQGNFVIMLLLIIAALIFVFPIVWLSKPTTPPVPTGVVLTLGPDDIQCAKGGAEGWTCHTDKEAA